MRRIERFCELLVARTRLTDRSLFVKFAAAPSAMLLLLLLGCWCCSCSPTKRNAGLSDIESS